MTDLLTRLEAVRKEIANNSVALDTVIRAPSNGTMRPTRAWSMGCAALMDRGDRLADEEAALLRALDQEPQT